MASRIVVLTLISCMLLLSCGVKRPVSGLAMPHLGEIHAILRSNFPGEGLQDDRPQVFKKILNKMSADLIYPDLVYKIYESKGFKPVLVPRFLPGDQLQIFINYLNRAGEHGLNSELFSLDHLKLQFDKLSKTSADTARENHRNLAMAELAVVASLIRYSLTLQYGLIIPQNVYPSYTTPTAIPDSISILRIFEMDDLKSYLDSIQPKDKLYLGLQKMLSIAGYPNETDSLRTILVNLERLRWKNRPLQDKFVSVNIPEFVLNIMNKGKSVLQMKVCVGEPGNWQTPQLGSMIHSVQVNPVWNIPQSIARDEIAREAGRDRYYLANSNIKVYHKGKLVGRSESIDWSSVDVSEYAFQQQPGSENALGRIKFLFQNESSVYLHDTPVKVAFNKKMRAVSHGCVRVEKPLDLAYALFGKGKEFDQVKNAMLRGYPRAKFIALPKQIPVRLSYYTAWLDERGKVQFGKDIYGLDPLLYQAIKNSR